MSNEEVNKRLKGDSVTTSIRLPSELHKQVLEISEKEVRSLNNLIEYVLTLYVRQYQDSDINF